MESLTADDDARVADDEIEGPRQRTELGRGPPVVRGHLVTRSVALDHGIAKGIAAGSR
jgi:hypothetical protein